MSQRANATRILRQRAYEEGYTQGRKDEREKIANWLALWASWFRETQKTLPAPPSDD